MDKRTQDKVVISNRSTPKEVLWVGADGTLVVRGDVGLRAFIDFVIKTWQAGDDLYIKKAEFIKPKSGD